MGERCATVAPGRVTRSAAATMSSMSHLVVALRWAEGGPR